MQHSPECVLTLTQRRRRSCAAIWMYVKRGSLKKAELFACIVMMHLQTPVAELCFYLRPNKISDFRFFFFWEIALTCSTRCCTTDPVAPPIWGSSPETIFWEMTQHYRDPAQGRSSNHSVDVEVWRLSFSLRRLQRLVWALIKSSHFYEHKSKRWKKNMTGCWRNLLIKEMHGSGRAMKCDFEGLLWRTVIHQADWQWCNSLMLPDGKSAVNNWCNSSGNHVWFHSLQPGETCYISGEGQVGCPSVGSYGAPHVKQSPWSPRSQRSAHPAAHTIFPSVHHLVSDSRR